VIIIAIYHSLKKVQPIKPILKLNGRYVGACFIMFKFLSCVLFYFRKVFNLSRYNRISRKIVC